MYKVDVVILSWNRLDDTVAAIESCRSQKGVDVKVFVVDQGSDRYVVEGLSSTYSNENDVFLEFLGENVGVAEGRNIGNRLGVSPFIFSLDNDAKFTDNNFLRLAVERIEKDKNISVLTLKIINYKPGSEDMSLRSFASMYDQVEKDEYNVVRFSGGAHLLRRENFLESGGYDGKLFFGGEEEDLSRKLINLGKAILYTNKIFVIHKEVSEGRIDWSNGRYYYLVRNRLYLRRKFGSGFFNYLFYLFGYVVKGIFNRVPAQAIKGAFDSYRMYSDFLKENNSADVYQQSEYSKLYMHEHEQSLRGGKFSVIKKEVFSRLPRF